jgi:hypothetical protein
MKKQMMMSLETGIRKVCGQARTLMLVMGKKGRRSLLGYMVPLGWLVERAIKKGKARTGHPSNSYIYLPLKATTVLAWEMMVVSKSTKSQRNIEM